ncbi:hypothetical protein BJ165DRAFT_16167 [Panaeolus papilionaceus]|nr:hypothetical protein BJ165DRAFT_16167 [Panaeolus papilionaceus]
MGGAMFTFHSKNKVTASSSSPAPFTMPSQPSATSSKAKSKSTARPSAPRPPPVVTEFAEAEDRLLSIPEGKENDSHPSTSKAVPQETQSRHRRSAGPSDEALASRESLHYHPYAKARRLLKQRSLQAANVPTYAPRTDVHYDHEKNTMIASMELPGVKKDDIRITLGTSKYNHVKFVHIVAESFAVFGRVAGPSESTELEEPPAEEANMDADSAAPGGKSSEAQSTPAVPSMAPKLPTSLELVNAGLISPDVRERRYGILKRAFPVPVFTKVSRPIWLKFSSASYVCLFFSSPPLNPCPSHLAPIISRLPIPFVPGRGMTVWCSGVWLFGNIMQCVATLVQIPHSHNKSMNRLMTLLPPSKTACSL